jgi:dTDP-4-dehydrorhamnose reductase
VRVLVTGAGGQLGRDLVAAFEQGSTTRFPTTVVAADHARLDVGQRDAVLTALLELQPDVVVHAAAWTAVDACEADPDRAFRVNALGTRHVAEGCRLVGAHLCYISTDYVFDGRAGRPYLEWDAPNPLSVYGRSKLGGEQEAGPGATIVRTAWVCGRHGTNVVRTVLRLLAEGAPLRFVCDQLGSPTSSSDLAQAVRRLALERLPGVYHVTNEGQATWYDVARLVVGAAGGDPGAVQPVSSAELDPPRPAPRPRASVLDNAALRLSGLPLLPPWQEAFERLVRELTGGGVR